MELKIWAKTLLTAYRYLDRICGAIDKLVITRALGSSYVNSLNYCINNCYNVSEKIINLSERKITLINLKILITEILKGMNKDLSKIIILKHIDNMKSDEISQILDISTRTYFRKINHAYEVFSKSMIRRGFSLKKIEKMLIDETWIMEIYNRNKNLLEFNSELKINENNEEIYRISISSVCGNLKKALYAK